MFANFVQTFVKSKTPSSTKSNVVAAGGTAAVMALATWFIMPWEGLRTTAYLDKLASPPVWTVCYGHTGKYAYQGASYSVEKCDAILKEDVGKHYDAIKPCINTQRTPVSVQASALELAFNVGSGAFCRSTMAKLINAGDYKAACGELDRWVKAGGVTVKGLVNRRNASEDMCVRDL